MVERTSSESSEFGSGELQSSADPVYCDSAQAAAASFRLGISERTKASSFSEALSRTIESEIIPRLLLAHSALANDQPSGDAGVANDREIADLVDILIRETLPVACRFVDAIRDRGMSAENVVAELLPAAARHVGWLWETDACTFVDVTFALSRLQQLLRHYAPAMGGDVPVTRGSRRVLLSTMPGEQHTFGVSVVEELLRRGAWDVVPIGPATPRDLIRAVREGWYDIVGLSAAADGSIAAMTTLIPQLRAASANRSIRIVAGGAAVLRSPTEASVTGVDAIVRDPIHGMKQMEDMIRAVHQPS